MEFCKLANLDPLTINEGTMCLFVAHLAKAGLQATTVKSRLSAIFRSLLDSPTR